MVLEPQIFVAEPLLCMSWMIGIVSERLKWAYVKRWRLNMLLYVVHVCDSSVMSSYHLIFMNTPFVR